MRFVATAVGVLLLLAACSRETTSSPLIDAVGLREPLPTDRTVVVLVGTHCGVERITADDRGWITEEPTAATTLDWVPIAWAETLDSGDELLALNVRLSPDRDTLVAERAGRSVVYRPTTPNDPVEYCA